MKKIIITILSLAIVLSFSACGDKEEAKKKADQTKAQTETQSSSEKEKVVENTPDSKEAISASDAEPETAVNTPAQEQQIPSVDTNTPEQQTQSVQASEPEKAPVQQAPAEQPAAPANTVESVEPAQVVSPFAADPSEFKPAESQVEEDSSNWEQFLKEYDKWADEYIAATKKFASNPTDVSAAADFQAKLHEYNSWSARASEVQMELTSASEKNREKYQKELTRITTKLSQAMPQAAQD